MTQKNWTEICGLFETFAQIVEQENWASTASWDSTFWINFTQDIMDSHSTYMDIQQQDIILPNHLLLFVSHLRMFYGWCAALNLHKPCKININY